MIKRSLKLALLPTAVFCMVFGTGLRAQSLDEARTSTKNEQYDKAEELFQQLIKNEPSNSTYYFYYGENKLLDYFADTISNSLNIAMRDAAEVFNKGIEANPADPLNYVGLARVAFYNTEEAKAEELRVKARSLLPTYKKVTKIKEPKSYAFTLAKIAESYIRFEQVDTSKALPFIREAVSIDPRNSEVYLIAGDIYILVNDGSKAIKNYNLAQDWDLQSPTANMKIGSIYVKGRNLMAAIPYYEQAIALDQNYAPAYRELGQLYSMAGRFNDSKKYFEKYLELTQGNIPAKIRYVNALFYAREYEEVIKNVEEIFAIDNSRTYMNRIAGYSAYEEGNFQLAKQYMDRLFANLDADRLIKKDFIYYARILARKNQNYYKMLIDADNDAGELSKLQARSATLKGAAREKALADIDTLKAKVEAARAQIKEAEAELADAFTAYDRAINFENKEDLNLLYEKGTVQYAAHMYADAASTWSQLLEKGRDSENDYIQVGRAFYQDKAYDKADEIFAKMAEKYPDNLQPYLWMANTAAAKDPDFDLGIARPRFQTLLQKAAVDSVKNVKEIYDALRFLGYEALQSKRYDEARAYYNRMMNLSPDYRIRAHSSLSTMYMTMGEYQKAVEENNKILAIEPGNEAAKSAIQYISQLQRSAQPKAHPNEITGVISDSSGEPIAGASVRVKDTAAEAWTNARGEYKFVMPEASEALIISAKGYRSIEIPVTKRRTYNATLEK
ncbi:MAG: tetratricopeptide repeat protein [Bacteroidales bacterium]|jgi:tetratricopeptide (TPR) repeat protein|nr:tetratricopeptide repeat protein [Bacteroidales bacterium]